MRPSSRQSPPPPPPPEDPLKEEAEAIASASTAMMAAAATMITEMFAIAAKQMEEAVSSKLPPDGPVQASTAAMIAQLQAQLNRALGVTPKDGLPKEGAGKDGEPRP